LSLLTKSWATPFVLNLLKFKPGGEFYNTFNSTAAKNKGNYHKNTRQSDGFLTLPVALWRLFRRNRVVLVAAQRKTLRFMDSASLNSLSAMDGCDRPLKN
jgi:hypothetical protein